MPVTADVEIALRTAAAVVNSSLGNHDDLQSPAEVSAIMRSAGFPGPYAGSGVELDDVRTLRIGLRRLWRTEDPAMLAQMANRLLRTAHALPQLVHDTDCVEHPSVRREASDPQAWHLHLTPPQAPLAERIAAQVASALFELLRDGETRRLRVCSAGDCDAVLVDLSRNRSRRFCDTGNCGNRQHVAAYRARRLTSVRG